MFRIGVFVVLLLATLGACSGTERIDEDRSTQVRKSALPTISPSQSPSPAPSLTEISSPSPVKASPSSERPEAQGPKFVGNISSIDRSRLPHSWREGCPVGVEDLRLLTIDHWGFDGQVRKGELVVHRDQAAKILAAMRKLFDARFPIEKIELVDRYDANDDKSMDANNTSAFNCREVEGRPGVWSQHSYGRAIDINPIQNPYVSGSGEVSPAAGAAYADRSKRLPGMIRSKDAVVSAFASIGWKWGGYWSSAKDYQHFSSTGR